jgi:hypothetical protein
LTKCLTFNTTDTQLIHQGKKNTKLNFISVQSYVCQRTFKQRHQHQRLWTFRFRHWPPGCGPPRPPHPQLHTQWVTCLKRPRRETDPTRVRISGVHLHIPIPNWWLAKRLDHKRYQILYKSASYETGRRTDGRVRHL